MVRYRLVFLCTLMALIVGCHGGQVEIPGAEGGGGGSLGSSQGGGNGGDEGGSRSGPECPGDETGGQAASTSSCRILGYFPEDAGVVAVGNLEDFGNTPLWEALAGITRVKNLLSTASMGDCFDWRTVGSCVGVAAKFSAEVRAKEESDSSPMSQMSPTPAQCLAASGPQPQEFPSYGLEEKDLVVILDKPGKDFLKFFEAMKENFVSFKPDEQSYTCPDSATQGGPTTIEVLPAIGGYATLVLNADLESACKSGNPIRYFVRIGDEYLLYGQPGYVAQAIANMVKPTAPFKGYIGAMRDGQIKACVRPPILLLFDEPLRALLPDGFDLGAEALCASFSADKTNLQVAFELKGWLDKDSLVFHHQTMVNLSKFDREKILDRINFSQLTACLNEFEYSSDNICSCRELIGSDKWKAPFAACTASESLGFPNGCETAGKPKACKILK